MRIFQVDAFTSNRYTGNPATVVLVDEELSDERYAAIAREFSHAETAFVLPPTDENHDIHVRFFNSRKEAAFVGHATLAVHHVLLSLGLRNYGVCRQRSQLGIMSVTAMSAGKAQRNGETNNIAAAPNGNTGWGATLYEFRQTAAALSAPLAAKDVLAILYALGLPQSQLHRSLPAVVASKGSTRLLLPLASADALARIEPDFGALVDFGTEFGIDGYFPFVFEQAPMVRCRSRMFCPSLGIPEDPVSGNAHAMLATYLWQQPDLRPLPAQFTGLQGDYINRPGSVNVRLEVETDVLIAAHIGGHAVIVSEGQLTEVDNRLV